jgi:hypothetical protein
MEAVLESSSFGCLRIAAITHEAARIAPQFAVQINELGIATITYPSFSI